MATKGKSLKRNRISSDGSIKRHKVHVKAKIGTNKLLSSSLKTKKENQRNSELYRPGKTRRENQRKRNERQLLGLCWRTKK